MRAYVMYVQILVYQIVQRQEPYNPGMRRPQFKMKLHKYRSGGTIHVIWLRDFQLNWAISSITGIFRR